MRAADLELRHIAFCNIVRCRTRGNAPPDARATGQCIVRHLDPWIDALAPRLIAFLGTWAAERGAASAVRANVPFVVINRDRARTREERAANHAEVARAIARFSTGSRPAPDSPTSTPAA